MVSHSAGSAGFWLPNDNLLKRTRKTIPSSTKTALPHHNIRLIAATVPSTFGLENNRISAQMQTNFSLQTQQDRGPQPAGGGSALIREAYFTNGHGCPAVPHSGTGSCALDWVEAAKNEIAITVTNKILLSIAKFLLRVNSKLPGSVILC